ncbi:uncharacterized protein E0L32_001124 [Thyridium curvatum]|uniref:Integral membrane protein n=1 Tax=Thyridium curvatum TaxID=1093900 RepID=A0A507AX40_9PEZI|nr:uncharacterized protein E0L32_001124 [Thyridium curvatum]TPX11306.1 hypothetical protein E0L32_001124 [Thyridium curvatum]
MEVPVVAGSISLPSNTEIAPATPLEDGNSTAQARPEPAEKTPLDPAPYQPIFVTPSKYLTFIRHGRGRYRAEHPTRLANSLLVSAGFFEAANAGDFAANVWNEIPVPTYAVVFMAVGGAVALSTTFFAAQDALLSWRNIRGLKAERSYLQGQRERCCDQAQTRRTIDCLLDMNFRETGTEWVDRVALDVLMGLGALLISVGTILAIFGADPAIYRASNLLSGYVGNVPCAVCGLLNLVWSLWVWRRACRHESSGSHRLQSARTLQKLQRRTSGVKLHGALTGITGVVASAASLVTATMWWGYVVLAPCIVAAVAANFLWRKRIGYTRPFVRQIVPLSEEMLEAELQYVEARQRETAKSISQPDVLARLVSDPASLACALDFLLRHGLFEDFCVRVLADAEVRDAVGDVQGKTVSLDAEMLATADGATCDRLLAIAKSLVTDISHRYFLEQERYILECLGCYMTSSAVKPSGS